MSKEDLLEKLSQIVIDGNLDDAKSVAEEALVAGVTPVAGIHDGLAKGMKVVGDKFASREYFLPEVLLSATTMQSALEVFLPKLDVKEGGRGSIVVGTVEGDIHDIGKDIVKALLTAAGYMIYDLGRDVPAEEFIKKAKEVGAQVIAMSTLMTPTLEIMREVEEKLKEAGLKGKVKTIIGGGSVTTEFAEEIGSDAFGKDAGEAVAKVKALIDSIMMAVEEIKDASEKE
jgi:corrinoid protein of di/trimethylamine methyltransferase